MKIWLIRHGMTRLGEEKRYQGRTDEGLSEKGRLALRPARELYPEYFSGTGRGAAAGAEGCPGAGSKETNRSAGEHLYFGGQPAEAGDRAAAPKKELAVAGTVHLYVSPAARARQTARILFPDAAQTVLADLREMDFGSFEGRNWREMENDLSYRRWVDGGCLGQCPGGEDRTSFSLRVCRAFEQILAVEGLTAAGDKIPAEGGHTGVGKKIPVEAGRTAAGEKIPAGGVHTGDGKKIPAEGGLTAVKEERQVVIVAHGGTQMAVLEKYGRPAREYFQWQTPCGCGWLLEPDRRTGTLNVLGMADFTDADRCE